eukprot:snap_masked-scaffold_1-processed-gene-32.24-mRNA-1 protein AED:1.00 eAED:1.00 QI:0/0/0/0/1/1/2/0/61
MGILDAVSISSHSDADVMHGLNALDLNGKWAVKWLPFPSKDPLPEVSIPFYFADTLLSLDE